MTVESIVDFDASKAMLIKPFAAQNDIRYYICGINVRPCAQGGVMLAATDGHRLVAIYDETGKAEREVTLRFNVPRAVTKFPARVLIEGKRLVIRSNDTELFVQAGDAEIDGKFPDWLKVVPDFSKLTLGLPGAYNAKYLSDLLDLAGNSSFVQFYMRTDPEASTTSAVVCRYSDRPELVGVLMPARYVDHGGAAPDWLRKAMPAEKLAAVA